MARSLNQVQLIGNLTRDPELRYTPNGTAVCSFGLATNRSWKTDSGEKHDEAEFHNIVSWNKLAELCSQFLVKGRKVYVEGRLATRTWTGQDGAQRNRTEIVISDMILLDSNRPVTTAPSEPAETIPAAEPSSARVSTDAEAMADKSERQGKKATSDKKQEKSDKKEEPVATSAKGHSTLRGEPSLREPEGSSEPRTAGSDSKSSGPLRQSSSEASEPMEEVVPDDIPF